MCALPIDMLNCQLQPSMNLLFQISTKAFVFSVVVVVVVVVAVYVCFCVCICFVSSQDRLVPRVLFFMFRIFRNQLSHPSADWF